MVWHFNYFTWRELFLEHGKCQVLYQAVSPFELGLGHLNMGLAPYQHA